MLRDARAELEAIISTDLATFNRLLEGMGAGRVITDGG